MRKIPRSCMSDSRDGEVESRVAKKGDRKGEELRRGKIAHAEARCVVGGTERD